MKHSLPIPLPLPQPLAPTILLSVSMNLTPLGTQMSGIVQFVFLCLAYFTEHNVPKVHPCYSRGQNLLPF